MGGVLADVRVVDLTGDHGALAGRLFADLGADVVRVDSSGAPSHGRAWREVDGVDLGEFVRTAGTRVLHVDPDRATSTIAALLAGADVALVSRESRGWGSATEIASRHAHLIVVANTPFGLEGECAEWPSTELVAQSTAGFLYRAGVPELPPVAAPGRMAEDMGAVVSVLGALLALRETANGGPGQIVDVAATLALAHCTDMSLPLWSLLGMVSSRNGAGAYPLHECEDGLARIVLPMSPGEWRALIGWLGSPPEWSGGEWDEPLLGPTARAAIMDRLPAAFAAGTREELAAQGDACGVRITPVLTPAEVLVNDHVASRRTFVEVDVTAKVRGALVASPFSFEGVRPDPVPPRRIDVAPEWSARDLPAAPAATTRPLAGVRLLEIGTGVASPEGARMFAEWGAEVIKIEDSGRPDFQRIVMGGTMNPAFATVARGKQSFDVDLTTEEGLALVHRLVGAADVVVENNAAGVLSRLGLGWDVLHERTPRLVLVGTQLYGDRGPWSAKKGYGPSARAIGGLTWLWAHGPDQPRGVMTIHPDHLAGRLVAIAALAGLHDAARTGIGRRIDIAQFEAVILLLAEHYLHESITPGAAVPTGNIDPRHAPWGLYRCADEDDRESWLAICVQDDEHWAVVRAAADGALDVDEWSTEPSRVDARDAVDAAVGRWVATREAGELEERLRTRGVPVARVLHPALLVEHPLYRSWHWPVGVDQPGCGPLLLEGPALRGSRIGWPDAAPAPVLGADTARLARELLGLSEEEVARLRSAGVLGPEPAAG